MTHCGFTEVGHETDLQSVNCQWSFIQQGLCSQHWKWRVSVGGEGADPKIHTSLSRSLRNNQSVEGRCKLLKV